MSLTTLGLILLMLSCQRVLGGRDFERLFINYYRNIYLQNPRILYQMLGNEISIENFCKQRFENRQLYSDEGVSSAVEVQTPVHLKHFPEENIEINGIRCVYAPNGNVRRSISWTYVPTQDGLVLVKPHKSWVYFY